MAYLIQGEKSAGAERVAMQQTTSSTRMRRSAIAATRVRPRIDDT